MFTFTLFYTFFVLYYYIIYYGMLSAEWKLMNLRNNDDQVTSICVVKHNNKANRSAEIFPPFFIFGLRNFINLTMVQVRTFLNVNIRMEPINIVK